MEDLTYTVDSKLGQYGFYYDEKSNNFKFVLDYLTDPKFGQYVMYYDIISSGALRYDFRFNVDPTFGSYTFIYSPLEKLYIEQGEVLARINDNNKVVLTDSGISGVKREASKVGLAIDSFSELLKKVNNGAGFIDKREVSQSNKSSNSRGISVDEFISLLFYESIIQNNIAIIDSEFSANRGKADVVNEEQNEVKAGVSSVNSVKKEEEKMVVFEERAMSDEIASHFSVSTIDVLAKIKADKVLMDSLKRSVEIAQRKRLRRELHNLSVGEEVKAARTPYSISEESHDGKSGIRRQEEDLLWTPIFTTKKEDKEFEVEQEALSPFNQTAKTINREDKDKLLSKTAKGKSSSLSIKDTRHEEVAKYPYAKTISKNVFMEELDKSEKKVSKPYDDKTLKSAPASNMKADKSIDASKSHKDTSIDGNGELMKRTKSKLSIEDSGVKGELEAKEVIKETEERLELHKRFWFLDSLGEVDYKILPNVDYKYPANIDIFKSELPDTKYVYKYTDKFKELGNYRVRLYNEDLSIAAQHEVIHIKDYHVGVNGIRVKIDIKEIEDDIFNYEVDFEIRTNTEASYMVINQPEGLMGNEFVFVSTEKFMADNHPIPFGEDLGLREIPVAISIMVDFMNILLLLWSKRHLAFSGMTGTQAITGMNELVYEWLTLDTSLAAESIEDYHRCYRWFRWESEKVYNKAKQDPNLKGNKWIEEVVFEMVDYIEMHHFNKMPEWDDVLRMDEQRNIFNSPEYDIPIVLDKFKGVRKRVMDKNKRYN